MTQFDGQLEIMTDDDFAIRIVGENGTQYAGGAVMIHSDLYHDQLEEPIFQQPGIYRFLPVSTNAGDECCICGETVAPTDEGAEMYDPATDEGGSCHAECGTQKGWQVA